MGSEMCIRDSRETLKRALSEFKGQNSLLLVVRADKKATHEAVIRVLDVAQELGLTNVTFATKQVVE